MPGRCGRRSGGRRNAMMQGGGMPVLTVNTKREVGKKAQSSNIAAGKVHTPATALRLPACAVPPWYIEWRRSMLHHDPQCLFDGLETLD